MNIEENIIVEAHPIVAGPVSHTSSISQILYVIMEPHSVLAILNHYKLTFDMIFFIHQLNTKLKNSKMVYSYCVFS